MSVPLYLIPKNFNPENPIPNNPFYSPPALYSQGPWFPFIVGTGFTFNYETSTINATGSGGGSPATPTVLGSVLGCTVANWTALGCNALLANTGAGNTAIGVDALCSTTSGINQTAVGFKALSSSVTSTCGVAVGWCALPVSTVRNLAVGAGAGLSATTGGCNTLIGHRAGEDITTGCFNTALGYRNLTNLTTGLYNTVVGPAFAGTCLTTESCNVLLGGFNGSRIVGCNAHVVISDGDNNSFTNVKVIWDDSAAMDPGGTGNYGNPGDVLTSCGAGNGAPVWAPPGGGGANATPTTFGSVLGCTDTDNAALGCNALAVNAGALNAAVGSESMFLNTSGSYNTALGASSLAALTTGNQNISIGYASGAEITVETGNTVVGSVSGEVGCSDNIFLGNGSGTVLGLRINECGAWSSYNTGLGLNTPVYGTAGQVLVSCGPLAAPQWTSTPTITVPAATPTVLGTVYGCTASDNAALGLDALAVNAGGLNTAVGGQALCSNTSGSYNTALGSTSLAVLTTGGQNIGIGYVSGSAITVENGNAVFGSLTGEAGCDNHTFLGNGSGSVLGLRINECGAWSSYNTGVGLNTPVYGTAGQVLVSCGPLAAPQWTSNPIITTPAATPTDLGTVYGCTVVGCTSLGCNALLYNTGTNNVAIGENALYFNTTGCYNTVAGHNAMCGNTTGGYNTALGVGAMSVGDPDSNVAIGYFAANGTSSNTGNSVVIGYCAGAESGGFCNVIIGSGAAPAITGTGQFSVIIGQGAGQNLQNSCNNVFIGRQAGRNVTDGAANTVIGTQSGRCLTTGNFNTIIGTCVAYLGLSTGCCNIYLGSAGGAARCLSTEDNNVVIGNSDAQVIAGCSGHVLISSGANGVGERVMAVWNDCAALDPGGIANYGASGEVLTSQGNGAPPIWASASAAIATPTTYGTVLGCTGAQSAALGCNALLNNSSDSNRNVAIGGDALCLGANGLFNTAVGYRALREADVGNRNTGIGFCAAAALTTGTYNTSVGAQTLINLTTGSRNTAIGPLSGSSLTTGSCITILGGYGGEEICTCVGYAAVSDGRNDLAGVKVIWDCGGAMSPGGFGLVGNSGEVLTSQGANTPPVWLPASAPAATPTTYGTVLGCTTSTDAALGCNALLSGTGSLGNVAIGSNSLCANTSGNYNTAIGLGSLQYNTTSGSNVAVGTATLACNTDQGAMVAVGHFALASNTTGSYNTAVGYLSQTSSDSGLHNTGLGHSTLRYNTSGSYNTAVGSGALCSNVDATGNTAIGACALTSSTTGCCNTAIGLFSQQCLVNGRFNVSVGWGTLRFSTTGEKNVAIGCNNLRCYQGIGTVAIGGGSNTRDAISGDYNVFIGWGSGCGLETGEHNTAIGYESLRDVTSGNRNVGVGRASGYLLTTEQGNVVLGSYGGVTGCDFHVAIADGDNNNSPANLKVVWNENAAMAPAGGSNFGNPGEFLTSQGPLAPPTWTALGASGTFTSQDGKTITVTNGLITSIV